VPKLFALFSMYPLLSHHITIPCLSSPVSPILYFHGMPCGKQSDH
jgi:hypothetical protein